jgi:hypothetical protein
MSEPNLVSTVNETLGQDYQTHAFFFAILVQQGRIVRS